MPTPIQTGISNVNSHIGSNRNSLNDGQVRNLANQGGQISLGQCRWGIQFPAYKSIFTQIGGNNTVADYSSNDIYLESFATYPQNWETISSIAESAVVYILNSNGTGTTRFFDNQTGDNNFNWTWLQSGSASNYTARFDLSSGSLWGAASSATGTDLSLSTTRQWAILAQSSYSAFSWSPNPATAAAAGTLTIKNSSGSTLISRPITLTAQLQVGFPF